MRPERAHSRPERADFRHERADFRPESTDFRPERANSRPERADFRPERVNFRPDRANLRSGGDKKMDERTDGRNDEPKSPCVLQDFIPFGAAAQKPISVYLSQLSM